MTSHPPTLLTIGCMPGLSRRRVADLLLAVSTACPAAIVGARTLSRAELRQQLGDSVLDIALLPMCPGTGFEAATLWEEDVHVLMAAGDPLAGAALLHPDQFAGRTFLVPRDSESEDLHAFLSGFILQPGEPVRRRSAQGEGWIDEIADGDTLGLQTASALRALPPRLVSRPIAEPFGSFSVGAHWMSGSAAGALGLCRGQAVEPVTCLVQPPPA
jgi:hypothetical protein